jgi:serine/threonine protein phosphatase PrpC/ribosomal protein L40E
MEQHSGDVCPACGAQVSSADNFCEKCGRELSATAVSTGSATATACRNCGSAQITADGYCEMCGQVIPSGRDHVEVDLGVLAGVSDRGHRHFRNEDAMGLALTETPTGTAGLAVVCDGVSTSTRPDEASLAAAQAALRALTDMLPGGMTAAEALPRAVLAADAAVRDLAGQSLNAPAATIVSAVVTADAVVAAWIGDSRAYWLPADHDLGSQLLTRDDSLAAELAAAGALPEADAITSPHAHIVTRWLGADADAGEPHSTTFQPPGPGLLLLCTDGLWNYQPEADGLARLAGPKLPGDLAGAAADLLAFALGAGGQDNVTIVLVAFPPDGNSPRST